MPISRRPTVLIALIASGVSSAAVGQDSVQARPERLTALMACRSQTDPTQRLACFDAAAASLDQAERQGEVIVVDRQQVTEARRQLFGFDLPSMPSLFERGERAPALNAVETTLTRATPVGNGLWVFTLGDGSVWRQVNMEATRFSERPGQPVRVRRAAVGSYLLTIGSGRAVRVRRVNE